MKKHKTVVKSGTKSRNPKGGLGWTETSKNVNTLRKIEKAQDQEKEAFRPIEMNFKLFIEIVYNEVLDFRTEWNIDQWNESYTIFKDHVTNLYNQQFVHSVTPKELVIIWAKDFYSPARPDTHEYWVKIIRKRIDP